MMASLFRILLCSYILFKGGTFQNFQKHFCRTTTDQFKNTAAKILFEAFLYFRCGHYKTWSKNTVPYNPSKTGPLFRLYEGHNTQNIWSLKFRYSWRLHQAVPMSKWYAFSDINAKESPQVGETTKLQSTLLSCPGWNLIFHVVLLQFFWYTI